MSKQRVTLQSVIQSRQDRDVFSGEQKAQTWSVINHHIQQTSFSAEREVSASSFVSRKRFMSGAVLASVFGVLYGIWGLPSDSVIFDNQVFTLLRGSQTSTVPRALASSVGQVIAADGSYNIINDGITYSTNMIYDGDTIELVSDARLSFMVDGHQAYIVGPASVRISVDGGGYRFTMIDGEFLEIFSSQTPSGSSLTVEMRDIVLAHNADETTMKVQFSADDHGDTIVKNYADPVLVVSADDDTDTKDLATETQLTIAPRAALSSATESSFSLSDIAFVSDTSLIVEEGKASLLSLSDDVQDTSPITITATAALVLVASGSDGSGSLVTTSTLTSSVSDELSPEDILVSDRVLPTDEQLSTLRQLVLSDETTMSASWDRVVSSYQCARLPADVTVRMTTIRTCVAALMNTYHLPPSLVSSLGSWMDGISYTSSDIENIDDPSLGSRGSGVVETDLFNEIGD